MAITVDELEELLKRLLGEGVPAGVVSRVLKLDAELVKEAKTKVRISRYGTDDLQEYTEQLQWDALESARETLATGSATEKKNIMSSVLGKQIALNARRTPEATRRTQESILALLEQQKTGTKQIPEQSKFVVRAGEEDVG